MNRKGFTLIELLVVIAIIGILSSVVLASLNTARDRGTDAAIKSEIQGMRAAAEINYDADPDYSEVCTTGSDPRDLYDSAVEKSVASAADCVDGTDVPGSWAAEVQLTSDTGEWFCADSTGASVQTTGSTISSSATPADAECGA